MVFFTADTHLGHNNIIRYCKRPFDSIEEMDDAIISNWNKVVKNNDEVFHLGDFAFKDFVSYRSKLNGRIHLILGNHDIRNIKILRDVFEGVYQLHYKKIYGVSIVMCHFAMRVWHKSHFNSWQIYGHSHGFMSDDDNFGKVYDVGVDKNNFTPVSFDLLKEIMDKKPNNFNWLSKMDGYDEKEFQAVKKIDDEDPTGEVID